MTASPIVLPEQESSVNYHQLKKGRGKEFKRRIGKERKKKKTGPLTCPIREKYKRVGLTVSLPPPRSRVLTFSLNSNLIKSYPASLSGFIYVIRHRINSDQANFSSAKISKFKNLVLSSILQDNQPFAYETDNFRCEQKN